MLSLSGPSDGATGQNTYLWPPLVAWAFSQRGGWVLGASVQENEPGGNHIAFCDPASEDAKSFHRILSARVTKTGLYSRGGNDTRFQTIAPSLSLNGETVHQKRSPSTSPICTLPSCPSQRGAASLLSHSSASIGALTSGSGGLTEP